MRNSRGPQGAFLTTGANDQLAAEKVFARTHDDTDRFGSDVRVTRFCGWRRPDAVAR